MNHTSRHDDICTGHLLTQELNRAHRQQARRLAPRTWNLPKNIRTIGDVVAAMAAFDDQSDQLIRLLLATPATDTQATDTVLIGVLGGVVHRNRDHPDRIADLLTELSIYITQRPPLRSQRSAANLLLDEANRRNRRALDRRIKDAARFDHHDPEIDAPGTDNVEALAIARIELDRCRHLLLAAHSPINLDDHITLSTRGGNDIADRKRLSRNRQQLRVVIGHELGAAA